MKYEEYEEKIIDNNLIEPYIKEVLINITKKIDKSFNYGYMKSIILENVDQLYKDYVIDYVSTVLKDYNYFKGEVVKDSDDMNYSSIPHNSLYVVTDYNYFECNTSSSDYYEGDDRRLTKKFTNKNNLFLIVNDESIEDSLSQYFKNNFEYLSFSFNKKDINYYEELINMYDKNNIKYDLDSSIVNKYMNCLKVKGLNAVKKTYNDTLKKMIMDDKNVIVNKYFISESKNDIDLDSLIGLDNIKKEIDSLRNYLTLKNKIKSKTNIDKMYLNMFFIGNPGTGKTTVTRNLANILYELGYIKENKVVEIIPTDLMANYVGQTKDKTRKILNKAKGGILFIDEAYLIADTTYQDGFKSFMNEAVVELIKYLENPDNVVIFAGYPKKMNRIYESNPGIKSRIFKEIVFEDYSIKELIEILKLKLHAIGFTLNTNSLENITKYIETEKEKDGFGNARFIEQLVQVLITNHANRKLKNETFIISNLDVPKINEQESFGF